MHCQTLSIPLIIWSIERAWQCISTMHSINHWLKWQNSLSYSMPSAIWNGHLLNAWRQRGILLSKRHRKSIDLVIPIVKGHQWDRPVKPGRDNISCMVVQVTKTFCYVSRRSFLRPAIWDGLVTIQSLTYKQWSHRLISYFCLLDMVLSWKCISLSSG